MSYLQASFDGGGYVSTQMLCINSNSYACVLEEEEALPKVVAARKEQHAVLEEEEALSKVVAARKEQHAVK
eukprot:1160511-Pelagomonas_calceolata.AAC.7